MTDTLILASQSASRRAMLTAAGVAHRALPAHADEAALTDALLAEGQKPRAIADALAELKALHISLLHPQTLVIGSDSMIDADGRLLDKPVSREDAKQYLESFSGKTMRLTSAVVVAEGGRPVWRHVDEAKLMVRRLSPDFIDAYLDAEWPAIAGCVGCFRIEAMGIQLFERIDGDHFTILGMPLLPLLAYLRQRGALAA